MGVWALGTKKQIQMFINDIEKIKEQYYGLVGSDAVFNGLDEAIREAELLMEVARDEQIWLSGKRMLYLGKLKK